MLKSGQSLSGVIVTKDATGALAAPSVGPAGTVYVNGVANAATVTVTGSNPYKWSVTLPTLTAGDTVSVYVTATISSVATAAVVFEDVADTKRVSDLNDAAAAPSAATVASQVRTELTTELGRMDAAITSRSTLDGAGVQGALTSQGYTAARAAKLDNLDAAVTSRLAGASYSAPPSTAAIVAAMDASSADLDTLITNLSTLLARLTATRAGYLDNLTTPPLTATQTANAVLDGAAADHNTAGSIGAKINAAGAAADPLLNAVPGSYPTGTAGWSLGKIGSGGVTAVSPVAADGGTIDLVIGDDFRAADGTGLAWTIDKTGLPTGAASGTATFRLAHGGGTLTQTGTITDGTTAITVAVDLTAAQTGTLTPGEGAFSLTVVMAATSYTHTLTREGTATIRKAAGR